MSWVHIAVLAGWMYLTYQGTATSSIWLCMNILDTARALRIVRPNGRRIGQATRRKAMKEALTCWIVFVIIQYIGAVPDKILGWLPFYPVVRGVVALTFLFTRASSSASIHYNIVVPLAKRYEGPIDLTISLLYSLSILISHYVIAMPFELASTRVRTAYSAICNPLPQGVTNTLSEATDTDIDEPPRVGEDGSKRSTHIATVTPQPRRISRSTAPSSKLAPASPTLPAEASSTPSAYPTVPLITTPPPLPFIEQRTVRRSTRRRAVAREQSPPSPQSPHAVIRVAPSSGPRQPPPASRPTHVPSGRPSVLYPEIKPLLPPSTSSRPVLADRANKRKVATLGGSLEKHTKAGRPGLSATSSAAKPAAATTRSIATRTRTSHQPLDRPARRVVKKEVQEVEQVGEKRKAPPAASAPTASTTVAARRAKLAKAANVQQAEEGARKRRRTKELS